MPRLLFCLTLLSLVSLSGQEKIEAPRPLSVVADRLQEAWARPVTYEDPVWLWKGDLTTDKLGGKWPSYPKPRPAEVPKSALANLNRSKDAAFATQIVEATNRLSDGPTFQVRTSTFGIHIVPLASANDSGRVAPVVPLLDRSIAILEEYRTPYEHLKALCKAITVSTGMRVVTDTGAIGPRFDQLFYGEENPWSAWGIPLKPARDALIDLLSNSATTFSWRFNCQPASSPEDRFCVLGLVPLMVTRTDAAGDRVQTMIVFDRCERCPKRLPPPPRRRSETPERNTMPIP